MFAQRSSGGSSGRSKLAIFDEPPRHRAAGYAYPSCCASTHDGTALCNWQTDESENRRRGNRFPKPRIQFAPPNRDPFITTNPFRTRRTNRTSAVGGGGIGWDRGAERKHERTSMLGRFSLNAKQTPSLGPELGAGVVASFDIHLQREIQTAL